MEQCGRSVIELACQIILHTLHNTTKFYNLFCAHRKLYNKAKSHMIYSDIDLRMLTVENI